MVDPFVRVVRLYPPVISFSFYFLPVRLSSPINAYTTLPIQHCFIAIITSFLSQSRPSPSLHLNLAGADRRCFFPFVLLASGRSVLFPWRHTADSSSFPESRPAFLHAPESIHRCRYPTVPFLWSLDIRY